VAEAVQCEAVSTTEFPDNREITANFARFQPFRASDSGLCAKIQRLAQNYPRVRTAKISDQSSESPFDIREAMRARRGSPGMAANFAT